MDPHNKPLQDAVLTVNHRMPFWKVEAFLKSLNRTGYNGRTVFFTSLLSRSTEHKLLASGAELHRFIFLSRSVYQRLSKPWPLWRRLFAIPQPQWLSDFVARRVLHLFYLRHLLYLRFLERNSGIERVLMCDSRDVYFQCDPFSDWPGNGLHSFEEHRSISIGHCDHHRRWISQLAGEKTLDRLSGLPRVCAGTILADRESALIFLRKMLEMTYDALSLEPYDGDQGLFNILIHERRVPGIVVHKTDASSVYTIGGMPEERIETDNEGFVLCANGHRAPILHQYDRKPEFALSLLAKVGL